MCMYMYESNFNWLVNSLTICNILLPVGLYYVIYILEILDLSLFGFNLHILHMFDVKTNI